MKNRLMELRVHHGMTQEDLAILVGVSRQTIISLEKGRYNPSLHLAHRLAQIFGTRIEEIFIFEEEDD
ncbi:MAG: helix-turn-helix transcriptional regulator [Syntrophomonadaceae bacterium]|jgi:putative transcriptional regulator